MSLMAKEDWARINRERDAAIKAELKTTIEPLVEVIETLLGVIKNANGINPSDATYIETIIEKLRKDLQ